MKTQEDHFLSGKTELDKVKNIHEYISKLASFVFRCVKLIFGLLHLPTGAVFERGCTNGTFVCTADIHQRTLGQHKRPWSHPTALNTCEVNCCLLYPQLRGIALTLTSNCGLCYFVHSQQEQQYSTYLTHEADCHGLCVYRITFRYFSNIPRSSPQSPLDPPLDIFSR